MEKEKSIKHEKLLNAHKNNIIISDKNLKDKYTKFEDSKLDESKTLLYEIEKRPRCFNRYFRGEIVRVKFGVNIGSEFSGDHFAIVISKGDTMMNPTLHVLPITSKKHIKSLDIGAILYNEIEIEKLLKLRKSNKNDNKMVKSINKVIKYYENRKDTRSYVCIDHIKTVSKLSVSKTLFKEFDYLPKLKCDKEVLNTINDEIINEYVTYD